MSYTYKQLQAIDKELKIKILKLRPEVLKIYGDITELRGERKESIHSLHGVVLGKNNTYLDLPKIQFNDFKDFLNRWFIGLENVSKEYDYNQTLYNPGNEQKLLIVDLFKNSIIKEYILLALERNFYKEYKERTRFKPDDSLWEIWFGDNNIFWGLFITPVLRCLKIGEEKKWTNDVSEIRRANFEYFTIGHLMKSGIVDPENNEIISFNSIEFVFSFYKNTLKRLSNSQYEKEIIDKYLNFLEKSGDIEKELLLIPEFRYGGIHKKHEYRLDFTILNPYTKKMIGFEFSPQSSHMSVKGTKNKKQKDINDDIKVQWEKEISKRNEYFSKYGISIITFTDEHLKDINSCFEEIKKYLEFKSSDSFDIDYKLKQLTDSN